jgi:hypothetical protein
MLAAEPLADPPKLELRRDDEAGRLHVFIDGREVLVYQFGERLDLPHYWPMNSPSGKNMLVQQTEPYPHHRSFWFADTVRLNSGTITADNGATGQEATNMKVARWIDYSNTIEGTTEGMAVFQWPDGQEHRWLTREYGTFGPRRPESQSGKSFTLERGDSITQRVAILVHSGNVNTGGVAKRYQQYVEGKRRR